MKNRKGIFEFILGGSTDTKLLEVRIFDEAIKKSVYAKQTTEAEKNESRTVHTVPCDTMQIRVKSGNSRRWMLIMSLHGAKVEQRI